MEQRFEESFNDLGLIYERYYAPNKAGGQKDAMEGNPSYRKGTFSTPQGSVNQYQANQLSQVTAPVSDEEAPDPIMKRIDELIADADDKGHQYTIDSLLDVKKFIQNL